MFIDKTGDYGDVELQGKNPALFQGDNPLRIRAPEHAVVKFGYLNISDCGMPIRHESGRLEIQTLHCTDFTADLFNSHGNLFIDTVIVDVDQRSFTEEDYAKIHPDKLGQFFSKTGVVKDVQINNIYARIRGELVQGFMLSEDNVYEKFSICEHGVADIKLDYEYAFVGNTLKNSYINVGDNAIKIMNVKCAVHESSGVTLEQHSEEQVIDTDCLVTTIDKWRERKPNTEVEGHFVHEKGVTRVAILVGHNEDAQGAVRNGVTEYAFWTKFLKENRARFDKLCETCSVEIEYFHRKPLKGYKAQMREVHDRIDKWEADISVECHFNGFTGNASGHETLYATNSTGGEIVAQHMQNAMDAHLANRDRGSKSVTVGENGGFGLTCGQSHSILIEPFFAKQLNQFDVGGVHREKLVLTLEEFFISINNLTNHMGKPVSATANAQLTHSEYASAMVLLTG